MKPVICTASGVEFDPINPTIEMIRIEDIAHALSHMPRFGGHTRDFYSVAQHSVDVSFGCDKADAGYGLLHDAAEAYLMDFPAPIKQLFPQYEYIERRLLAVIYEAFGLDPAIVKPPSVDAADTLALRAERASLMPIIDWWPADTHMPVVEPVSSADAKSTFLHRFNRLVRDGLLKENTHAFH
ncbi:MAG TPA: hypothetical protein VFM56_12720 [Solimonas sp.]|nr:hypothetical protein [Solimonas sp.]